MLQGFFSRNEWNEKKALERHQKRVAAELGGADGIFVIDETSDGKKGEWTAGVSRQYCGSCRATHLPRITPAFHSHRHQLLFPAKPGLGAGGKDLTVSQLADAIQVIVERRSEGIMSEVQILILAERLAGEIERTQWRNRKARVSARRRRIRELAELGIDPDKLTLCDECSL